MAFMQCDDEGEISFENGFSVSQFFSNFCADFLALLLHLHMENPLKKQTEHWMVIAPSDFRSKVADWCKIIAKTHSTRIQNHIRWKLNDFFPHILVQLLLFRLITLFSLVVLKTFWQHHFSELLSLKVLGKREKKFFWAPN